MAGFRSLLGVWVACASLAACGGPDANRVGAERADSLGAARKPSQASEPATTAHLAGTEWRLIEFQSMDDAIGTLRPPDPSLYTMRLDANGTVSMRLNCNRATGTWSSESAGDGGSGRFGFGPLAMTRALCPQPSMDERIAADAQYVRSYRLANGRLHLSLMADGGIYVWEP